MEQKVDNISSSSSRGGGILEASHSIEQHGECIEASLLNIHHMHPAGTAVEVENISASSTSRSGGGGGQIRGE